VVTRNQSFNMRVGRLPVCSLGGRACGCRGAGVWLADVHVACAQCLTTSLPQCSGSPSAFRARPGGTFQVTGPSIVCHMQVFHDCCQGVGFLTFDLMQGSHGLYILLWACSALLLHRDAAFWAAAVAI
jgi:hypothetical protein